MHKRRIAPVVLSRLLSFHNHSLGMGSVHPWFNFLTSICAIGEDPRVEAALGSFLHST